MVVNRTARTFLSLRPDVDRMTTGLSLGRYMRMNGPELLERTTAERDKAVEALRQIAGLDRVEGELRPGWKVALHTLREIGRA